MRLFKNIFKRNPKKKYVLLPNMGEIDLEYVLEQAEYFWKYEWKSKKWKFRPALIDKYSGRVTEYIGQKFDSTKIDLVDDGWSHDHCEICYIGISEGDKSDDFETEGFNYKNLWICKYCYETFIKPKDVDIICSKINIIEK